MCFSHMAICIVALIGAVSSSGAGEENDASLLELQEKLWACTQYGICGAQDIRDIDLDAALLQQESTAELVKAEILSRYSGVFSDRWSDIARRIFMRTQALRVLVQDASPRIRLMAYRLVLVADHAEALQGDYRIRDDRPTLFFLRADVEKALAEEKDVEVIKAVRQIGEWARSDQILLRKRAREILFYGWVDLTGSGNSEIARWLERFPIPKLPDRLNKKVAQEALEGVLGQFKGYEEAWTASNGRLGNTPLEDLLMHGPRFVRSHIFMAASVGHLKSEPPEKLCAFLQRTVEDEAAPLDHRWGATKYLEALAQMDRLTELAGKVKDPGVRAEVISCMFAVAYEQHDVKRYLSAVEHYEGLSDPVARVLVAKCVLSGPFRSKNGNAEDKAVESDRWWDYYTKLVARVRKANEGDPILQYVLDAAVARETSLRDQGLKKKESPRP